MLGPILARSQTLTSRMLPGSLLLFVGAVENNSCYYCRKDNDSQKDRDGQYQPVLLRWALSFIWIPQNRPFSCIVWNVVVIHFLLLFCVSLELLVWVLNFLIKMKTCLGAFQRSSFWDAKPERGKNAGIPHPQRLGQNWARSTKFRESLFYVACSVVRGLINKLQYEYYGQ